MHHKRIFSDSNDPFQLFNSVWPNRPWGPDSFFCRSLLTFCRMKSLSWCSTYLENEIQLLPESRGGLCYCTCVSRVQTELHMPDLQYVLLCFRLLSRSSLSLSLSEALTRVSNTNFLQRKGAFPPLFQATELFELCKQVIGQIFWRPVASKENWCPGRTSRPDLVVGVETVLYVFWSTRPDLAPTRAYAGTWDRKHVSCTACGKCLAVPQKTLVLTPGVRLVQARWTCGVGFHLHCSRDGFNDYICV